MRRRLGASLYAVVGNQRKEELDEQEVRGWLAELKDIHGENISNEIGDCDSFYGDDKVNYLYIY